MGKGGRREGGKGGREGGMQVGRDEGWRGGGRGKREGEDTTEHSTVEGTQGCFLLDIYLCVQTGRNVVLK